jgi:hypothetical protein
MVAGRLTRTSTSPPLTNSGLEFDTIVMDGGAYDADACTGAATATRPIASTADRNEFELIFK